MVSRNASEGIEPRNMAKSHWAKEFSIWKPVALHAIKGECVSDVPGSESMAGHSTAHSRTWDSHIVPNSEASNKPKRQRGKYGDMAVGLTHIRGVNGVMSIESQESGHSKGLAVKRRGMSRVCHTLRWITSRWQYCPHISTGSEGMLQYSWQGPSE